MANKAALAIVPWLACGGVVAARAAPTDAIIAKGAYLARVGDCVACHTAAGGEKFAGGEYLNSPFGRIATPNITPDKQTGIGNWTDDQFYRAMHTGVDSEGQYLYPAFPYEWFTKVTRDDVLAIKAYLFSLPPVHAPKKSNKLIFPFNIRAGIAGWNALYFKEGTFKPDSTRSEAWNRGAYIVEGLGHCAACHTPRNAAQAPIASEAYAGGKIDGWYAPNITSDTKDGIGGWSEAAIVQYLKAGYAKGKGVAFGPMAETVHDSLAHLHDDDLQAIAVYLKSLPPKRNHGPGAVATADEQAAGQDVYVTNCSSCHQPDGAGLAGAVPPLKANGAVTAGGPENVIRVVLGGLAARATYAPMPGFATVLSPQQIADVTNYVRTSWGNSAAASATSAMVASLTPKSATMMAGTHWCHAPSDPAVGKAAANDAGLLSNINDSNELPQMEKLVADVRRSAPNTPQDRLVNGLTASYCQILFKDASVLPDARGPRLDRFASLAYTVVSKHGR